VLKQFRAIDNNASAAKGPAPVLSERETDVLRLVAQGYINKEIAQRLGIGWRR
jgi:DNA-binding CsgD family transcriptional regulator